MTHTDPDWVRLERSAVPLRVRLGYVIAAALAIATIAAGIYFSMQSGPSGERSDLDCSGYRSAAEKPAGCFR